MEKTKTDQIRESTQNKNIEVPRPARLEIDLGAFSGNFDKVKAAAGPEAAIMAVVKANAYGHGLIEISRQAEKCGAAFLGVAFVEEGERLIGAGIRLPIVVLYPDLPERAARLVSAGLIATADSIAYLNALSKAAVELGRKAKVFLKIETGMGRYGLDGAGFREAALLAQNLPGLKILGVSTNLADSNSGDHSFTMRQFKKFAAIYSGSEPAGDWIFRSIENSSGLFNHHQVEYNLVRVGISLYGAGPESAPELEPVMSLRARIIQIKSWPAGAPIGYGGKFRSDKDMKVATIGVGYADGYPWSLSNKGWALIRGRRAAITGNICMDAMMLDVTDVPGAQAGDEVVLLGRSGEDVITAGELSRLAGSFPYELLSRFSGRLPRIYRRG